MSHHSDTIEEHEEPPESKNSRRVEYRARPGEILHSISHRYKVLDFLGEGTFGQVLKCSDEEGRMVAIKMLAQNPVQDKLGQLEFDILTTVGEENSNNIVKVHEYFKFENKSCLVFECLEQSLASFHEEHYHDPLPVPWIRTIVRQLLTALSKLKDIGLIHLDLKPQNIMLVDTTHSPYHVKIIDFGSAVEVNQFRRGTYAQTRFYRSPEVILGTECTTAVDIWSLGCIAAELLLGLPLFPGSCEYYQIRYIVEVLGMPGERMLDEGKNTRKFFRKDESKPSAPWTLRRIGEYKGTLPDEYRRHDFRRLDDIRDVPTSDEIEEEDLLVYNADIDEFVDILKKMLAIDPLERITPSEALKHPFFTLDHMVEYSESIYTQDSMGTLCLNVDADDDMWESENNAAYLKLKKEIYQQIHFEDIDALNGEIVLDPGGEPIEVGTEYENETEDTVPLYNGSVEDRTSQSSQLGEQTSEDCSSGEDKLIIIITDNEDEAENSVEGIDSSSGPGIECLLSKTEAIHMTSEDSSSGDYSSIGIITDSEDEDSSYAENSEGEIDEEENVENETEIEEVENEFKGGEPIDSDEVPFNNNWKVITLPIHSHTSIRDQEAVEDSSQVSLLRGCVKGPQMHLSRLEKRTRERCFSNENLLTHLISDVGNNSGEGSSTNNDRKIGPYQTGLSESMQRSDPIKKNNSYENLPKRFKNDHFMGFSKLTGKI